MSDHTPITDSEIIDGLSVRYLKFFGLWRVINDYRTTGKKNTIMKLQLAITLMYTVPYIFCQILSFFLINTDLPKATFITMHSLGNLQICCKVLVRLANLMRKDLLQLPEHKKPEAKEIFKKIAWPSNFLPIAALTVNTSYYIVSITMPDTSVDYILYYTGNMFDVTTGRKKIMGGWYPLPIDRSPYYEIVYVYEATLFIWFAVLGIKLSILNTEEEKIRKSDSQIYIELQAIIKHHQKLLSYADELRVVYNPLVTMILGISVFVLILATFQFLFGTTATTIFIIKSLIFLPYQAIEVCMFCYASSYLETASSDVQFAIYNSDWYKSDIKFRKTAQMMMIRARKGESLKAFSMYPINVETMMSIFQFTYTVSALMLKTIE